MPKLLRSRHMPGTFLCLALFILQLLSGCTLETAAREGVDTVKEAHDKQLVAGETLICGSSLRAMLQRYGADHEKLGHVMALCGYLGYFQQWDEVQ